MSQAVKNSKLTHLVDGMKLCVVKQSGLKIYGRFDGKLDKKGKTIPYIFTHCGRRVLLKSKDNVEIL